MTDTTPSLQSLHSGNNRPLEVNTIVHMANQAAVQSARSHKKRRRMRRIAQRTGTKSKISLANARKDAPVDAKISKRFGTIEASPFRRPSPGRWTRRFGSIETSEEFDQVQGKVKGENEELSKSLEIALKAARECTDDCAVGRSGRGD